jgi:hypothetical protein
MGSTPVASGSKLPVWPALLASNRFLTRCKAWLDDNPRGLLSRKIPFTERPRLRLRANANDLRCPQADHLDRSPVVLTLRNQSVLKDADLDDHFHQTKRLIWE